MEQLVRDVRVTQIYDGTNGIQALDLVTRKLYRDERLAEQFFAPARAFIEAQALEPAMAEFVQPLSKSLARLQQVTA